MMNDLESQLIASRKIREFLKNFSETQWSRVVKASIMMGIQELEKSQPVTHLSVKDLEEIVVQNESQVSEIQRKLSTDQSIDSIKSADFKSNQERRLSTRSNNQRLQKGKQQHSNRSLSKGSNQENSSFKSNKIIPSTTTAAAAHILVAAKPKSNRDFIKQSEQRNLFKNSFKSLALRRRDLETSDSVFWTQRSNSQPAEGGVTTARFQSKQGQNPIHQHQSPQFQTENTQLSQESLQPRSDSQWRQPQISKFQRNGQRLRNRLFNEDIQGQKKEKRSKSLNPLIYPSWWGDDEEDNNQQELFKEGVRQLPENQEVAIDIQNRFQQIQQSQVLITKYDYNNDREDSLDRRLKEAKEAAAKLDTMFKNKQNQMPQIQTKLQQDQSYPYILKNIETHENLQNQLINQNIYQNYEQHCHPNQNSQENQGPNYRYNQKDEGILEMKNTNQQAKSKKNQEQNKNVNSDRIMIQYSPPRQMPQMKNQQNIQDQQRHQHKVLQQKSSKRNNKQKINQNQNNFSQLNNVNNKQKDQQFSSIVPKYLKNVQSKIKDKVKNDRIQLQQYNSNQLNQQPGCPDLHVKKEPEVQIYFKEKQLRLQQSHYQKQLVPQVVKTELSEVYNENKGCFEYRPHQYNNQHDQKQNTNVAEIADGFLSSPLMTQFSEDKRQMYHQSYNSQGPFDQVQQARHLSSSESPRLQAYQQNQMVQPKNINPKNLQIQGQKNRLIDQTIQLSTHKHSDQANQSNINVHQYSKNQQSYQVMQSQNYMLQASNPNFQNQTLISQASYNPHNQMTHAAHNLTGSYDQSYNQTSHQRNQFSTYYHQNPFSFIQQEDDIVQNPDYSAVQDYSYLNGEQQKFLNQKTQDTRDGMNMNNPTQIQGSQQQQHYYPPVRTQNVKNMTQSSVDRDLNGTNVYSKNQQNQYQAQNQEYQESNQKSIYHRGQQSAVGMTMILNNLNNNTMFSDAPSQHPNMLYKSDVFDQNLPPISQTQTYKDTEQVNQNFSANQGQNILSNYQSGAQGLNGHLSKFLEQVPEEDSKLMSGASTQNIDKQNQVQYYLPQQQNKQKMNQQQEYNYQQQQYYQNTQIFRENLRESDIARHRATASQPFEYLPQNKGNLHNDQTGSQFQKDFNDYNPKQILSPMSDDPHHYSLTQTMNHQGNNLGQFNSYNNLPNENIAGFSQILKRDVPTNKIQPIFTPQKADNENEISKSSISQYTRTDDIRKMFSDPSAQYLEQDEQYDISKGLTNQIDLKKIKLSEESQNTSMIDTQQTRQEQQREQTLPKQQLAQSQLIIQDKQNKIQQQEIGSQNQMIQHHNQDSRYILPSYQNNFINDSVTSPSSYEGNSMISSSAEISPTHQQDHNKRQLIGAKADGATNPQQQIMRRLQPNRMETTSQSSSSSDDDEEDEEGQQYENQSSTISDQSSYFSNDQSNSISETTHSHHFKKHYKGQDYNSRHSGSGQNFNPQFQNPQQKVSNFYNNSKNVHPAPQRNLELQSQHFNPNLMQGDGKMPRFQNEILPQTFSFQKNVRESMPGTTAMSGTTSHSQQKVPSRENTHRYQNHQETD